MQEMRDLKTNIRFALAPRWGGAVLAAVTLSLINFLMSSLVTPFLNNSTQGHLFALAIASVLFILYTIFRAGFLLYFLHLLRGETARVRDLWAVLRMKPDRFLIIGVCKLLLVFVYTAPLLILARAWTGGAALLLLLAAWALLGGALLLLLSLTFFATLPLLLDNENMGPLDALKESALLLRGRKGPLLYLIASFAGWLLPMLLTGGLANCLVHPYFSASLMQFYRHLRGESLFLPPEDHPASEETFRQP